MSNFTIHRRRAIELYYTLDGKEVEENDQIPDQYVVRYNMTEDPKHPAWEDQADFNTLEEARQFLQEIDK